MPGIHIIYRPTDPISEADLSPLASCKYLSETVTRRHLELTHLGIFSSAYEKYPLEVIEDDKHLFLLEGKIYNRTLANGYQDWLRTYEKYRSSGNLEEVRGLLMQFDGDYIITFMDKTAQVLYLLNDPIGRLPLYYSDHGNKVIISREIDLMARSCKRRQFDRTSLYFHLLFGYVPGCKTIFENVERLPSGSIVKIDLGEKVVERNIYHSFDFSDRGEINDCAEAVDLLTELFTAACRSQYDPASRNVLSLSGGLDSRAVAAGLHRCRLDFATTSFLDGSGGAQGDVRIAAELAAQMGLTWDKIELDLPSGEEVLEYLRMKAGFISLTQAGDLQYHREIVKIHGPGINHFSGDGGDKLLPNLRPSRKFKSLIQLADYIIARHKINEPKFLATVLDIPEDQTRQYLVDRLASYPESQNNDKYVHFMIYERGMKWLFEGEDRNRCSFWTATPFYSLPFFERAMALPHELKRYHNLYRQFQINLNEQVANIAVAGGGLPITHKKYERRLKIISLLARHPHLMNRLRRVIYKSTGIALESNKRACLIDQLKQSESIGNYFDRDLLLEMVLSNRINQSQLNLLFDLTSSIEYAEETDPHLKRYLNEALV